MTHPTETGPRLSVRWGTRVVLIIAGAATTLAFPEPGWWWLGWVGLAPIFWIIARAPSMKEACIGGWMAGMGFMVALHSWAVPYTGIFTVPLALFLGLAWIPIGASAWLGLRTPRNLWVGLTLIPATWVVVEWARSWEYLGGTWGLWGLSQWSVSPILQAAAWGGVWLLSFVMVAVNVALAVFLSTTRPLSQRLTGLGVALAVPLTLAAAGATRSPPATEGVVTIAGVQAGVFDSARDRLDAHADLSETLAGVDTDLVVWGQTSVAFDPSREADVDARLRSIASAVGSDLLVNVDERTGGGIVKTSLVYTPEGPVASYGKQRLVPFGEYIPLRPLFGWVSRYTQAAVEDRSRGEGPALLPAGGIDIGPLVSYESTFPDMRRDLALLGADMTVVQGGTQTFQGTWAQPQQASYEAVNAVASGRPALLVAVSGVSAAFGPRGERLAWHPADWTGVFTVDIPLSQEETPYVRFGDWVVWISGLIILVLAVAHAAHLMGQR